MLTRAARARVRLITSAHILNEVSKTLVENFDRSPRYAILACRAILRLARLVPLPAVAHSYVAGDPNDDPIIETALAGKADYVVTADKVLLSLGKIRNVQIITLDEFASRLPE